MTTKGSIFYVVLISADKFERLSPMLTTASNARKEYDRIISETPPSLKRRVQLIQFVSV
jgi:PHD/YefM family antitoxin component YafN of YafNO toxin-antitoxin module